MLSSEFCFSISVSQLQSTNPTKGHVFIALWHCTSVWICVLASELPLREILNMTCWDYLFAKTLYIENYYNLICKWFYKRTFWCLLLLIDFIVYFCCYSCAKWFWDHGDGFNIIDQTYILYKLYGWCVLWESPYIMQPC